MNVGVHVLGIVMNVLCACLHVGPADYCVLGNSVLPPVCQFPYDLYSKISGQMTDVWEGVKGSTNDCKMIGDVRVASPLP